VPEVFRSVAQSIQPPGERDEFSAVKRPLQVFVAQSGKSLSNSLRRHIRTVVKVVGHGNQRGIARVDHLHMHAFQSDPKMANRIQIGGFGREITNNQKRR